jgi:hypothetical protein
MNYRANTIGAEFDIKPNQKNGTIVTCVLPVHKNGAKGHRNGSNGSRSNGSESAAARNGSNGFHSEAVVETPARF